MREPLIRYARTRDNLNIAFAVEGSGPVLVEMAFSGAGGLNFLSVPAVDRYYSALAKRVTVLTYDSRGFGNSQQGTFAYSQESHIADLEAVTDAVGTPSLNLFANFHVGTAGVAYAARHPSLVRSLLPASMWPTRSCVVT